jgi:hypothetical protein
MFTPVEFFLISYTIAVILREGIYIKSDLTGGPFPLGAPPTELCDIWAYVSNSDNPTVIWNDTTCSLAETDVSEQRISSIFRTEE